MNDRELTLEWLAGRYVVCRFEGRAPLPDWALHALRQRAGPHPASAGDVANAADRRGDDAAARFVCIMRTERELAVVIDESLLPVNLDPPPPIQRGFVALRIAGVLDFALVGVLAKLTGVLADAGIPVFALSTYDSDILLLREYDAEPAAAALRAIARFTADTAFPGAQKKEGSGSISEETES